MIFTTLVCVIFTYRPHNGNLATLSKKVIFWNCVNSAMRSGCVKDEALVPFVKFYRHVKGYQHACDNPES